MHGVIFVGCIFYIGIQVNKAMMLTKRSEKKQNIFRATTFSLLICVFICLDVTYATVSVFATCQ